MKNHSGGKAPSTLAIALKYDGEGAPKVTAKGRGEVADQILALAKAHDIPLHDDRHLVELLSRVELGDEVPATLYVAVAEVIAFAYYVSGRAPAAVRERFGMNAPEA
jgi:flagellar biosynthesis protein